MKLSHFVGFLVATMAFYQIGFVTVNAAEIVSSNSSQPVLVESRSFNTFDTQQQYYLVQASPAASRVDEARRIEAERKAKEEAELKARQEAEAAAARQAQLAKVRVSTPAPSSPSQVNGDFESAIRNRCAAVGCNSEQVIRVMYCESGGRSNAANPSGASGLFQFMPRTFSANASRIGLSGANIWNPYHQIEVATWMFANGQAWQWVCK